MKRGWARRAAMLLRGMHQERMTQVHGARCAGREHLGAFGRYFEQPRELHEFETAFARRRQQSRNVAM